MNGERLADGRHASGMPELLQAVTDEVSSMDGFGLPLTGSGVVNVFANPSLAPGDIRCHLMAPRGTVRGQRAQTNGEARCQLRTAFLCASAALGTLQCHRQFDQGLPIGLAQASCKPANEPRIVGPQCPSMADRGRGADNPESNCADRIKFAGTAGHEDPTSRE